MILKKSSFMEKQIITMNHKYLYNINKYIFKIFNNIFIYNI